jgi:FecR protein
VKRFFFAIIPILWLQGYGAMAVRADDSLQFKVQRSLVVQKVTGTVVYLRLNRSDEPAIVGTSLKEVEDGIRTGPRSTAVLTLDTNVGTLELSAETILRIQQMQTSPQGGYKTRLMLSQGQVRVKLKSFVNPESSFEVQTPSSVSGVRGTVFGVAVQPTGDTAVALESGKVSIVAHAQTLDLTQGQQVFLPINAPPVGPTAVPLVAAEPTLSLTWLSPIAPVSPIAAAGGMANPGTQVRIAGSISPLNLLQIADRPLVVGPDGRFDYVLPLPANRRIAVLVITPLGGQRQYELVVS